MCAWSARAQGRPAARRLGLLTRGGPGAQCADVLAEQSEQLSTTVTTTGLLEEGRLQMPRPELSFCK